MRICKTHLYLVVISVFVAAFVNSTAVSDEQYQKCESLLPGQYECMQPIIDPTTQQPVNCSRENVAPVTCTPLEGLKCDGGVENGTFTKQISCRYVNGKDFKTALLLSIFLGWLGIDRFYLGYVAVGLFKMLTFGFFFIFYLIDIILIALQIVGPADDSAYIIDYYGPVATYFGFNNQTSFFQSSQDVHEL